MASTAHFILAPDSVGARTTNEQVTARLNQIVQDVADRLGERPEQVHVLASIGSVRVSASPSFLSSLEGHPEISRRIDDTDEDMFIRPVKDKKLDPPKS